MSFRFVGPSSRRFGTCGRIPIRRHRQVPTPRGLRLRSQMNRAVSSIALNIAEGAAKGTNKAFDYHLEIGVGSTFEGVGASFLALDRGYITEQEQKVLYDEGERLAKSINAFRSTLR